MALNDLRYGWRLLVKRPGFTLLAVLSIAIGIGANASIFGFADALVLRPIPAAAPDRLVRLHATWPDGTGFHSFSHPTLNDLQESTAMVFEGLSAEYLEFGTLGRGDGAEAVATLGVSANFFDLMGVAPAVGRFFFPEEDETPGAHPVAVLGHSVWQRRFAADPGIVGSEVRINNTSYTVVGVAPESFTGTTTVVRVGAFVPAMMVEQINPGSQVLVERSASGLDIIGRLAEGVGVDAAQTVVSAVAARLEAAYPEVYDGRGIDVLPAATLPAEMRGTVATFMALLMALVALVLTIACANVATMLLARAAGRRREMALRLVSGASRGRLVRQLITETMLLFTAGGAAGIWIAVAFSRVLGGIELPLGLPVRLDVAVDERVLAFTALLSLVAGLVAGLAPALQASGSDPALALKGDDPRSGGGRSRLRSGLVVGEVALALVLVVAAGLFVQALRRAAQLEPGFDAAGVIVANLDLTTQGYGIEQARSLHRSLVERVAALPGVEAAALADMVPLALASQVEIVNVPGFEPARGSEGFEADTMIVSPEYFATLRMPLVAGRGFASLDGREAEPVAVVNETMARRFWAGRDPIGQVFRIGAAEGEPGAGTSGELTVVGVVRDAKYRTLGEDPRLYFYRPFEQAYVRDAMMLHARSDLGPAATVAGVRGALRELDPNLTFLGIGPMEDFVALSLLPQRLAGGVAGSLGLVGLLLAAVGLYGVTAYLVGTQTREFGVRMALGATPRDVLADVLRRGVLLASIGVAAGVVIAVVASRGVSGFLYGASPLDPVVFGGAALLFLAVAIVASLVPAWLAARTDPIQALRYE